MFVGLVMGCQATGKKSDLDGKEELPKDLKEISGIVADENNLWVITDKPKAVKDETGTVIDFEFGITNNMFASYANKDAEELIGTRVSTIFKSYHKNGLFDKYKRAYNSEITDKFEFEYREDNVNSWFDITVTKIDDTVLISITDLTHIKKLQFELERTVEDLKRSNENLKEFAYAASHFADRLKQKSTVSDEDKGMFDRMMSAAKRMTTLIEDLLNYSRVSSQTGSFEEIKLNDVLFDVLDNLEASIQEKQATIVIEELPKINGNRQQLRQLFQNLVSNSIKYAKPNVPPRITVSSKRVTVKDSGIAAVLKAGNELYNLIEVKDNGIGFEQEYSEKIFKVFQRLHGRSEYSGTGVGLAIVRKVVEYHGGYITAEGEPNKGATFKIFLPVVSNEHL